MSIHNRDSPLHQIRVIDLPSIPERRGNLTFIESNNHIPFNIQRVYYLYDIPSGTERGVYHHNLQQLLICVSGSFSIVLDDGSLSKDFLNSSKGYIYHLCFGELN